MDEHLNSDPYESLKPNKYSAAYYRALEDMITPIFLDRSIRVWHYTRLLDEEVLSMKKRITPSTLTSLQQRLEALRNKQLLTQNETDIIFQESPFQNQKDIRSNRFWAVTIPISSEDCRVKPLLKSWGGESAYFWLSDEAIAGKLKSIGQPRIVEVETQLRDCLDAYSVASTASQAWAASMELTVSIEGSDLAITNCLETASVLKVHSVEEPIFRKVGKTYPDGCDNLQKNS
ncbi:hypothetical protein ACJJID_02445 [Microbulbifer sp. CnH-101-G]|uniref:hypothetical protein n=1 Tax=Microbulbifer sp. CnH-101-G TaxID=3243393 RepID=UPI004039D498